MNAKKIMQYIFPERNLKEKVFSLDDLSQTRETFLIGLC